MKSYIRSFIVLAMKLGPKLLSVAAKILKSITAVKGALAAASFATYSIFTTWQFALTIMFMLFVHESGHVWAMRRCGVKTKGFYFLPFVGGAAVADSDFPSRKAEVYIAIMGPIWGLILSALVGLMYVVTGEP